MAQRSYRSENFARVHYKRAAPEPSASISTTAASSSGSGQRLPPIGGSSSMVTVDQPPQTASGQKRQQKGAVVTLEAPRPQNQRATNEYVETPFLNPSGGPARATNSGNSTAPATQPRSLATKEDGIKKSDSGGGIKPADIKIQIEEQNSPQKPQQDAPSQPPQQPPPPPPLQQNRAQQQHKSIICATCHKCRCKACCNSGKIRGCSVCGNHLFINANSLVEWLSCMCCFKGFVYHCLSKEDEGNNDLWMRNPYSCLSQDRARRFTWVALCTVCLPCMLLYWPLYCLAKLIEWAYRKMFSKGCRCPPALPRNDRN